MGDQKQLKLLTETPNLAFQTFEWLDREIWNCEFLKERAIIEVIVKLCFHAHVRVLFK
jgi:hypothetical protein